MARLTQTVKMTIASNVRTYRQLRGIEQSTLARHMQSAGFAWRQVTVSEVERGERNVTVSELFGLALTLGTTVEKLIDTRGPEGRRGPRLVLSDRPQSSGMVQVSEPDEGVDRRVLAIAIKPEDVTALVCSHEAYADTEWSDQGLQKLEFVREDQP